MFFFWNIFVMNVSFGFNMCVVIVKSASMSCVCINLFKLCKFVMLGVLLLMIKFVCFLLKCDRILCILFIDVISFCIVVTFSIGVIGCKLMVIIFGSFFFLIFCVNVGRYNFWFKICDYDLGVVYRFMMCCMFWKILNDLLICSNLNVDFVCYFFFFVLW